jgi:hypothetical protein
MLARAHRLGVVAALAILAAGAPASADRRSSLKYEEAFRRGTQLFKDGRWADARIEFQAAYAIDPRPVLLFNIASTYRREKDRVNARVYYKWFIDKAGTSKLVDVARQSIAEIDAELNAELALASEPKPPPEPVAVEHSEPAPVAVVDPYPQAVIDRPATLPVGTARATTGMSLYPRVIPPQTGAPTLEYDYFASLAVAYGATDRLEIGLQGDIDLNDTGRSLLFGVVSVGVLRSKSTMVGASGTLAYGIEPRALTYASLRASLRIKLGDRLALTSSEDQLVFERDGRSPIFLRLPIGVAYQVTPTVYASVSTRLASIELREPDLQLLFSGYEFVAFDLAVAPRRSLDAILRVRAYDAGADGVLYLSWRI